MPQPRPNLVRRAEPGWHNSGYIFPEGFASRVSFRSSVVLDALCVHECAVLGAGGQFWPAPTFRVTAMDRPGEPLVAKSCTGCWSGVRPAACRCCLPCSSILSLWPVAGAFNTRTFSNQPRMHACTPQLHQDLPAIRHCSTADLGKKVGMQPWIR